MRIGRGKQRYSEKTCPCATLSTTNPTRPDLGLNPGHHIGKPAANSLSYGRPLGVLVGYFICTPYYISSDEKKTESATRKTGQDIK
jgi:hypothetical protein